MRDKIFLVVLLLLMALGVYGFLTFFERYEEEVNLGWGLEARQNPYLAAEIFLNDNSVDVDVDATLQDINFISSQSTIFIQDADRLLPSAKKIDSALTWAAQGGHLVLSAGGDAEFAANTIFQRLGVDLNTDGFYGEDFDQVFEEAQKKLSEQLKEINESDLDAETVDDTDVVKEFITISFSDGELLDVSFPQHKNFELANREELDILAISENESGIYFLQIAYERGVITLLPDSYLWQSYDVGYLDNAYFLLKLIDSDSFSIVYIGQSLSLWSLFKRYAYELVLVSVLGLIFWLWFSIVRRGRVVLPKPPARRELSEYVAAMSEFFMAENNHRQLLTAVKKDVFDKLLKKDRSFLNYEPQTQAAMIVEYCQGQQNEFLPFVINSDDVVQWLERFEQQEMDEIIFVEQVKLSHAIRKRL